MCETSSSICSSPIGYLTVSYCRKGLHFISQLSTSSTHATVPDENQMVETQSTQGKLAMPESCLNWLQNYFHKPHALTAPPDLCPDIISKNDSFQKHVWRTLLNNVHFGQTITYGELADLAGNRKAARAVGTAMRRNPFQLIVPCHRVIRSNGETGNYAGGERNHVKLWLLKHEGKKIDM